MFVNDNKIQKGLFLRTHLQIGYVAFYGLAIPSQLGAKLVCLMSIPSHCRLMVLTETASISELTKSKDRDKTTVHAMATRSKKTILATAHTKTSTTVSLMLHCIYLALITSSDASLVPTGHNWKPIHPSPETPRALHAQNRNSSSLIYVSGRDWNRILTGWSRMWGGYSGLVMGIIKSQFWAHLR